MEFSIALRRFDKSSPVLDRRPPGFHERTLAGTHAQDVAHHQMELQIRFIVPRLFKNWSRNGIINEPSTASVSQSSV